MRPCALAQAESGCGRRADARSHDRRARNRMPARRDATDPEPSMCSRKRIRSSFRPNTRKMPSRGVFRSNYFVDSGFERMRRVIAKEAFDCRDGWLQIGAAHLAMLVESSLDPGPREVWPARG